jgi:hypothetical protein
MHEQALSMIIERFAWSEQPVFRHGEFAAFGADLRRLLASRLLVRTNDAAVVPCPNQCQKGCDPRVLAGRRLALCSRGQLGVWKLTADDLTCYVLKPGALAKALAKANDLTGRVQRAGDHAFRLGQIAMEFGGTASVWLLMARQEMLAAHLCDLPVTAADRPALVLVPSAELGVNKSDDMVVLDLARALDPETLQVDWGDAEELLRAAEERRGDARVLLRLTDLPEGQHPPRSVSMLVGDGPFEGLRKPVGVRELFFLALFAESGRSQVVNNRKYTVVEKRHALARLGEWVATGRITLQGRDRARPGARVAKMWREFVRQMNMTPGLAGLFSLVMTSPGGLKAYAVAMAPHQIAQDLSVSV